MKILGIDPGISGAFVLLNGVEIEHWPMPLTQGAKHREVDFRTVWKLVRDIKRIHPDTHVFLERAVAFRMGCTSAFNYGRGFAALEIAVGLSGLPFTLIMPGKWTKVMHEGTGAGLKPKQRSKIAVARLYPQHAARLRKLTVAQAEGAIDALLIAGYGFRTLAGSMPERRGWKRCKDFSERDFCDDF